MTRLRRLFTRFVPTTPRVSHPARRADGDRTRAEARARILDQNSRVLHTPAPLTRFRSLAMRLTTKGRYAVTAMLDLALHGAAGPVTLADISTRQGISQSYLEQLFGKLKRARLVQSLRGPGGGYALTRAPRSISVSEIISACRRRDRRDALRRHRRLPGRPRLHHPRSVDGSVATHRRFPRPRSASVRCRTRRGSIDCTAAGCAARSFRSATTDV